MNVVLIVLDTLRRDHLGCYGYERDTSPNIDSLAAAGTRFTRCYATDVPTIPSFTALLSGQRGIKTGRISFSPTEIISNDVAWMPEKLSAAGYTTGMVSTLYHMGSYFNRGFLSYMNPVAGERRRTQTVEAEEINSFAIPWLRANHRQKFFLFVHYWDPHVESIWGVGAPVPRYRAPDAYRKRFYPGTPKDPAERSYVVSQYDANIAYADEHIGKLLAEIKDLGIESETMIVFVTDHGENLGESRIQGDDLWDHPDIYESIVHIPLIIRHPAIRGGNTVDGLVENVDITSTIVSALGVDRPDDFDGRDLLPAMEGKQLSGLAMVTSETGFATCKRAVITEDGWKYIRSLDNGRYEGAPERELYNINDDPAEVNDLTGANPGKLSELEIEMARWVDGKLGKRPDPLRLRAHMGVVQKLSPYYSYIHAPQAAK